MDTAAAAVQSLGADERAASSCDATSAGIAATTASAAAPCACGERPAGELLLERLEPEELERPSEESAEEPLPKNDERHARRERASEAALPGPPALRASGDARPERVLPAESGWQSREKPDAVDAVRAACGPRTMRRELGVRSEVTASRARAEAVRTELDVDDSACDERAVSAPASMMRDLQQTIDARLHSAAAAFACGAERERCGGRAGERVRGEQSSATQWRRRQWRRRRRRAPAHAQSHTRAH